MTAKNQSTIIAEKREAMRQEVRQKLDVLQKKFDAFPSPIVVTILPLEEIRQKHLRLSRAQQEINAKLETLVHVKEETKRDKWIIFLGKIALGFFLIVFVVGRIVSAEAIGEIIPDIFGFDNPIFTLAIVEAIMVGLITLMSDALLTRSFTKGRLQSLQAATAIAVLMFIAGIILISL